MNFRSNHLDDPTLDPVERERLLMAEADAQEEADAKESVSGWNFSGRLALIVPVLLVTIYLVVWANAVQDSGGPEGYVRATEFVPLYTGALILRGGEGRLLYDLETQRATQDRALGPSNSQATVYDHVPFEALLIEPFAIAPLWVAFAAWTLVAGLALGLAVGTLDGALPVSRPVGWVLSLAACSYLPAIRALMLGQDSLFVLMGLCGTYLALKRGYDIWAGASMLLLALRPQALPVVVLLLLLQRRWKTLAFFAVLLGALIIGVMPVLGADWPLQYLRLILRAPNRADWIPGLPTPVYVLLALASIAAVVWAWLRWRDAPEDDELLPYEPQFDLQWALAGVVVALTTIYLNSQDLTLLIFPAWIIAAYATLGLWSKGLSNLWMVLLWVGYGLAPLSLYWSANSPGSALAVVPSVAVMALAVVLLAREPSSVEG